MASGIPVLAKRATFEDRVMTNGKTFHIGRHDREDYLEGIP